MTKSEKFWSIAELASTDVSVGKLATAIEISGVYTWDRFGRFRLMGPKNSSDESVELTKQVLEALSRGWKNDEQDLDYFLSMMHETMLSDCGWFESKLPNFDELYKQWAEQVGHVQHSPKKIEVAHQSKVYDLLEALLIKEFGHNMIADLKNQHSEYASHVANKLEVDANVTITPKTLKKYLKLSSYKDNK